MHARRQARNHIRSPERLGYKVTIQAINPKPVSSCPQPATGPHGKTKNPPPLTRRRVMPPAW